ncbi:MAG TPA: beta-ketoacyl-ACP synthase II [Spirochaetia bacterium]|nr:beta-ketoacyl-ACP synthase II [Spirochaetia bacterium]
MGTARDPREVRVVITGMGTINPIGASVREFWDNLIRGKSGVRRLKAFPIDGYSVQIAGEIDLPDLSPFFKDKKMARRLDRYVVLSQIAATQAVRDSGLDVEKAPQRYGVIIGTGDGGVGTRYNNTRKVLEEGMQASSPFFVMCIPNTASGYFALEWNLQGPCFSVSSACATGNHALGVAASLIKMGMADAIFAGGAEAPIFPSGMAAFGNIMALSERNSSPETASRPFDKDRDGFVLSEGAGVLCLEELEHAKRRRANIYAELSGYGFTSDAHDLVTPHPESRGSAQAMMSALENARLTVDQIDLINCHAASTPLGDLAESRAINVVFKDRASGVPAHSTKSMTGHPLGAASAVEAIAAILAIQQGVIHPTINQFEQDPRIKLNVIRNQPLEVRVSHVLSNGFGFGGQNAAVALSRFNG